MRLDTDFVVYSNNSGISGMAISKPKYTTGQRAGLVCVLIATAFIIPVIGWVVAFFGLFEVFSNKVYLKRKCANSECAKEFLAESKLNRFTCPHCNALLEMKNKDDELPMVG